MSIPRVDLLITDSRIMSLQSDYGDDYGINQTFFLVALNNANLEIQRYLVAEMCRTFVGYSDIPTVAAQYTYDQPSNIFSHDKVYAVFYSKTGEESDFYELEAMYRRELYPNGDPQSFIAANGKIYLDRPTAATGGVIRVEFEQRLDRLELRRGIVESKTLASDTVTALRVDITEEFDVTALSAAEYVCIVNPYGTIKTRNIKVLGFDSTTGDFTLDTGGSVVEAGSTIDAGDYVLARADSTTHSPLPDVFEDIFIDSIKGEVYEHVSEEESVAVERKLDKKKAKVAEIYSQNPVCKSGIPETRRSY